MKRESTREWQTLVHINGHAFAGTVKAGTAAVAVRRAVAHALKDPANHRRSFTTLAVSVTKTPMLPGALEAFTTNTVEVAQ